MTVREDEYFEPGFRVALCGVCGKAFEQRKLNARFLAVARSGADHIGAVAAIDREIPDGYVPLYCAPHERQAMTDDYGPTLDFVPIRKNPTPGRPQPHEPVTADDYHF